MENKDRKKVNELLYYGLYGLFLLLFGYGLILLEEIGYSNSLILYFSPLISSAGLALILIALVESRHLKKSLEFTAEKIVNDSSDKLDRKFKETFNILENCQNNGLMNILPPRQSGNETRETIAKEIENTNKILVFSISGLDFFEPTSGADAASGKYFNIISKRIDKAKKQNKEFRLEFKALLMNPDSEVAEFRKFVEEIDGRPGTVKSDIEIAKKGIEVLNNSYRNLPNNIKLNNTKLIEHLFYSEFPQIGFVLTDSYVFIELYHFAVIDEFCNALKELNLPASDTINNCIGGRIPVFQFKKDSNTYIAVEKHFDSIWKYTQSNGQISALRH